MYKIFFAIVIYNKTIEDSITCAELSKILKDEKVVIADNSTIKNNIEEECLKKDWKYISMMGNKGLSVAYNAIINYIKQNEEYSDNDVIMLLDDDTKITEEYVLKVKQVINTQKEYNIFLPIIKDQKDNIISPAKHTKLKDIRVKNAREAKKISQKSFLGINTCLTIRMKIFNNYMYTEKLFLDQVDNQFFYDMRIKNEKILCINSIIKQNFFASSNRDYNKEITRRKIEIMDYKKFVEDKTILEKIMCHIRIIFWKIRGCIKYKTIKYFIDLK